MSITHHMPLLEPWGFGICRSAGGSAAKGTIFSLTVSTKDCISVKPGYHISAQCSVATHARLYFSVDCTSEDFPDFWLLLGSQKCPGPDQALLLRWVSPTLLTIKAACEVVLIRGCNDCCKTGKNLQCLQIFVCFLSFCLLFWQAASVCWELSNPSPARHSVISPVRSRLALSDISTSTNPCIGRTPIILFIFRHHL